MAKIIHPTPNQFIDAGKLLPYGAYHDIIPNTSLQYWDKEGGIFKRRRTQRKAWIFTGLYTEELMVGLAIADAGFVANAFAYFYLPEQNLFKEQKIILPFGFDKNFDGGLKDTWELKNFKISTQNDVMKVQCKGDFDLEMELKLNDNGLSFICPTIDRPFNFTYKNLCLDSSVKIEYKGKTFQTNGKNGGIDFSKGYPPRRTIWNWASVNGLTSEKKNVGINLFKGHNGKYENAAWLDGHRILLSDTDFIYDKTKPLDEQEWLLKTQDGLVNLVFTPMRARKEKINAQFLSHDFTQPFGKFEGTIKYGDKVHQLTGFGPVEEHESLW